jgi:glycosyltransferase involved in cell wall biosynthesis
LRVLFLTQVLPYPLDSGAKIRAYYVIRHLARTHSITLLSFVRGDNRPDHVAHLARVCDAVHTVPMRRSLGRNLRAAVRAALTGQSAIILRDAVPEMHAKIRDLLAHHPFDVIHADQASMAQYARFAQSQNRQIGKSANRQISKSVLDAHNALFHIPERMAQHEPNPLKRALFQREARALARYEAHIYPQFDQVVFVSAEDREAIAAQMSTSANRQIGESQITNHGSRMTIHQSKIQSSPIIPICIDPADRPLIPRVANPRMVLHLGTMFWPPNIEGVLWFAREVFPHVRREVPDARFVVVGKNPPASVQALATAHANVEITGYVADPTPYLARTAAFIVPLRAGGGMRVKIVDAWGWGLPIVSTRLGAEGIDVHDGENLLLADTPDAFAGAVARLLTTPALGEHLRANGRAWVEERYNWQRVYPRWDKVYEKLR